MKKDKGKGKQRRDRRGKKKGGGKKGKGKGSPKTDGKAAAADPAVVKSSGQQKAPWVSQRSFKPSKGAQPGVGAKRQKQ